MKETASDGDRERGILARWFFGANAPTILQLGLMLQFFIVSLSFNTWRITFFHFGEHVLDITPKEIGFVFSVAAIPGGLAFAIGILTRYVRIERLFQFTLLALAVGFGILSEAKSIELVTLAVLAINAGFAFFYPLATGLTMVETTASNAGGAVGRLKSVGPLSSILAAIVMINLVAAVGGYPPFYFLVGLIVVLGATLWWWLVSSAGPAEEGSARTWRFLGEGVLLVVVAAVVVSLWEHVSNALLIGIVGFYVVARGWRRPQLPTRVPDRGSFRVLGTLWPYYALNLVAGMRSGLFRAFVLFSLVTEYGVDLSGTAILIVVGHLAGFAGYRFLGRLADSKFAAAGLALVYLVVAIEFMGFGFGASAWSLPVYVLSGLFVLDSFVFGTSAITDAYLRRRSADEGFVASVSVGMTVFYVGGFVAPALGGIVWEALGRDWTFAMGSGVALAGALLSRHLR